jgi:hypothetical protein
MSTNGGDEWSIPIIPSPADTFYGCDNPDIISSNGKLHMVWRGFFSHHPYQIFHIVSTNNGTSWSRPHQIFNNRSNYMRYPRLAANGDTLFLSVMIDFTLVVFRSNNAGVTWIDSTVAEPQASAVFYWPTILYSANRIHLIYEMGLSDPDSSGIEIWHRYSTDLGTTWENRVSLSTWPDHVQGQFPSASADDSGHLIATWFDYKYGSHCQLDGDILGRVSTDNGNSWLPETRVTYTQSGAGSSSVVYNSIIHLIWENTWPLGCSNPKIMYSESADWGTSWKEPELISDDNPTTDVSPNLVYTNIDGDFFQHCFFVRRDATGEGLYYIRYTEPNSIRDNWDITLQAELALGAYPNPFNSATTITLTGAAQAEIGIYDITGRLITKLHTTGGQALWDASGNSSGLYFARLNGEKAGMIKLILLK